MSRLLQQILAPLDANTRDARDHAVLQSAADDDLALGCECANPALQFESWEPAATPQGPAAATVVRVVLIMSSSLIQLPTRGIV